ncbi:protein CHUP1, chloroplastic [Tanacetum coccineum]|uniref:Protein CHUP1, chloroplastic n=1 Tax=Tanacetum coccineum TaxID=301880 RepID=A0ABQ5CJC1_9ASTR
MRRETPCLNLLDDDKKKKRGKNNKSHKRTLFLPSTPKRTTKEKVKSLALKAKVTREQTSDDSDSQGGSDEDIDEEEAKTFNFLARNFRKGNRFGCRNGFGNEGNRFSLGRGNSFGNKGGESLKQKGACNNCIIEGHFASECRKPKENKAFVVSKPSSSDYDLNIIDFQKENEELLKFNKDFTKTFEKNLKEKHTLEDKNLKLSSKINDLEIEVKKLANDKEVIEP